MSFSKKRISDVEIEEIENPILFLGKTYSVRAVVTCYGDFLVNSTDLGIIMTGGGDESASKHFTKICKRCSILQHQNAKLNDHFEVYPNHIKIYHFMHQKIC